MDEQKLDGRSELSIDDYGGIIPAGVQVFCGKFLEHFCFERIAKCSKLGNRQLTFTEKMLHSGMFQ